MKTTIGDKTYDTESAQHLAGHRTASTHQDLYRTPEGDFFLLARSVSVDGQRLGPHEVWLDLGPAPRPSSRLRAHRQIVALTAAQALEWCVKTQIPETFRGYLLECI